jgi:Tfp pilus assembly protein PilF
MRAWVPLVVMIFLADLLMGVFVGSGPYSARSRAAAAHNRGLALLAKGDTDGAIAAFDEALRLYPRSILSLPARATAHLAKHQTKAATADLDTAVKLDPTFTGAYVLRGEIERTEGNLDQAIKDYQTALSIDPTYIPAMRDLEAAKAAQGP